MTRKQPSKHHNHKTTEKKGKGERGRKSLTGIRPANEREVTRDVDDAPPVPRAPVVRLQRRLRDHVAQLRPRREPRAAGVCGYYGVEVRDGELMGGLEGAEDACLQ